MSLVISNSWSAKLFETIKDLEIVGLERSVKMSHRVLNDDRYIIGPKQSSVSLLRLKEILFNLSFPNSYIGEILELFKESNQIGLGFESSEGISTYRLYLEFFNKYVPDPQQNKGLLHIGYKWFCEDPDKMIKTEYHYTPKFNGKNLNDLMNDAFGLFNYELRKNILSLTIKSIEDIPFNQRIMTSATETEGCRKSFDINIYKSKKKLNFIKPELEAIAEQFKINLSVYDQFISQSGEADLGHLSCGVNKHNDPFFTVYFDDFSSVIKNKESL